MTASMRHSQRTPPSVLVVHDGELTCQSVAVLARPNPAHGEKSRQAHEKGGRLTSTRHPRKAADPVRCVQWWGRCRRSRPLDCLAPRDAVHVARLSRACGRDGRSPFYASRLWVSLSRRLSPRHVRMTCRSGLQGARRTTNARVDRRSARHLRPGHDCRRVRVPGSR